MELDPLDDRTAPTLRRVPPEDDPQLDTLAAYEAPAPRPSSGMGVAIAAAVAVLAALGLGAWWLLRAPEVTNSEVPAPVTSPAPSPPEPQFANVEPETALPSLDESDELVAKRLLELSDHPQFAAWLGVGSFVRRAVVVVDNVVEGVNPKSHLDFLAPRQAFSVIEANGRLVPSPESYARFDPVAEVVASVDMPGLARTYGRLKPLFVEAWRDLGHPAGNFDRRLLAAIDLLLATPISDQPPALVAKVSSYQYADPELEALTPTQKQLLRMGPNNARRVQQALRELRAALVAPTPR